MENKRAQTCHDHALYDEFCLQVSIFLFGTQHHSIMIDEKYVTDFGTTPSMMVTVWKLLNREGLPTTSCPLHLLWWLYLVRNYPTKRVTERMFKVCGTTYRKHLLPLQTCFIKLQRHVVSSFH